MDKVLIKTKFEEKLMRGFFNFYTFRKSMTIYVYMISALVILYLTIYYSQTAELSASNMTIYWAITVMAFTAIPTFTFGRINSIVKQQKKSRGETLEIIELTKYKIVRINEGAENKVILGWEQFESAYEVKDAFYLYIDKEHGLVLSKEGIVEGNVAVLRKLISNNIKKNRKGKPKFKKVYKEQAK